MVGSRASVSFSDDTFRFLVTGGLTFSMTVSSCLAASAREAAAPLLAVEFFWMTHPASVELLKNCFLGETYLCSVG